MKIRDIANRYVFDAHVFERWLLDTKAVPVKFGVMGGMSIESPQDIETAVYGFQGYLNEHNQLVAEENKRAAEEAAAAQLRAQEKQVALARMLITSGFNFDGYKITKYSGYISGDDVVQVDRGTGGWFTSATNVGDSLMQSLSVIRRNALAELKEAAYELGCNAVVGVDFDYLTLDPETANSGGGTLYLPYVFGVTANGNAVIIEKC